MSSSPRAALIGAPLAVALVLGGCSGGGSSNSAPLTVTYKDVATATRTAGPASTTGTATGPAGARGPVKGAVEGDLNGSGTVAATLFSGTTRNDIDILWRDKTVYVNRAEVADPRTRAAAGTQAWMLRAPTEKAWNKWPVSSSYVPELFSPFSPAALADLLAGRKIEPTVTRDGSQRKLHAPKQLSFIGAWVKATVDLWVDNQNRVTRVQISSDTGGMSYEVKYGGASPTVDVPASSSIEVPTPFTPTPKAPFVTVKSGSSNGLTWTLQRAPSVRGYECWRWQSTPPVTIVATDNAGNRCIPSADPTDDPANQAAFVASSNGRGDYNVLAIRLPKNARSVTVTPIRGAATTTPASGDMFVSVAPRADKPGSAVIVLSNGTQLACGPGWITTASDWSTVSPGDRGMLLASPWVCQD